MFQLPIVEERGPILFGPKRVQVEGKCVDLFSVNSNDASFRHGL
jgi:hypothetical protein